ncbi:alpha/beta hydrolase [Desulfovibrio sp. OttesenSCG-928-I05]|nr:alpha/beta hydrolase [Desulfovibrio sp. OttesenSCG-928-I05]
MTPFHEDGFLKSKDGLDIFFQKDFPANPKGVLVIVHGLAEHSGRYDYFVSKLNGAGYGVYRFDNRGHGKSGGERAYLDSFHEYLDDANMLAEKALAENPDLPVFLLGHSMGGFIAAGYGAKYPGRVKGQIFSGAAVRVLPGLESLQTEEYRVRAHEALPNALGHLVSRDQDIVRRYAEDPLVLKEFSVGLAGGVWKEGVAWLAENAQAITVPALILHGADDRIVPAGDSEWLYGAISSKDKELKLYPALYHEILNEPEKDSVIADILAWLDKQRG